jgi:hypothetical protein
MNISAKVQEFTAADAESVVNGTSPASEIVQILG